MQPRSSEAHTWDKKTKWPPGTVHNISLRFGSITLMICETLTTHSDDPSQCWYLQSHSVYKLSQMTIREMLKTDKLEMFVKLKLLEPLGLQRSNKLPWNLIFLDSFFNISQIEAASFWQSQRAVIAHVWNSSQYLQPRRNQRWLIYLKYPKAQRPWTEPSSPQERLPVQPGPTFIFITNIW